MKRQFYGIECKLGWWSGCGWTLDPKAVQWHQSYWEAKQKAERLEKPPKAPRYGKHTRIYDVKKPPPCRVIGKHKGNVLIHE